MKTKLFILFTSIICLNTYAQRHPPVEHIISTSEIQAGSVFTADFNGDGHMDVLSASTGGNHIDWWENDGGENFTKHNITSAVDRPYQIYAADLDGDGDMDVLSVSREDDKLAWYENLDGSGDFGDPATNQILITAQANTDGARFLDVGDIDGDVWDDVVSASAFDNKIAWYKNLGNGDFGDINTNQRFISDVEITTQSVHITDIDGDGYNDVVASSYDPVQPFAGEITWFKNDGLGSFGSRQIVEDQLLNGVTSVSSADFDGDGYMDVVSASFDEGKIAWHKNINGDGSSWETTILNTSATGAAFVYPTDYDVDGDMDILAAIAVDNEIVMYVNDGFGNFTEEIIITTAIFPVSVHMDYVDDYGDPNPIWLDVLSASVADAKIAWYNHILSVNDNLLLDFSVYPNPTTGILTIQSKTNIVQIEIYNQLGQLVLSNNEENTIDISNVGQGLYFIKILDENGNIGTQKVVKK